VIRRLQESDAAIFRAVRLQALRLHPEAFGSAYEEESQYALHDFARFFEPPGAAFGAFAGGRLVGTAGLFVPQRLKQKHKGTLVGVYVDASFRHTGAGRQLSEAVIAKARQDGLRSLLLAVTIGNDAAKRLYAGLGFQTYGIERRALLVNGVFYDEEMMALDLD
jgi:ribosomal protein S18 acetylase RimI-like enzyme